MSLMFKEEYAREKEGYTPIKLRSLRKNLRTLPQVGTTDKKIDEARKALMPGKRISKTGKVYWETRKNRSDSKGSSI